MSESRFKRRYVWGIAILLVINTLSWNPGWGGRSDLQPGLEIERYFGWPACYYCDIWRGSDGDDLNMPAYFFLVPVSTKMTYAYSSFGAIALLLNITLVVGVLVLWTLFDAWSRRPVRPWSVTLAFVVGLLMFLIVLFAHKASAYL